MSDKKKNKTNKTSLWAAIGAVILIILILYFTFIADQNGDPNVESFITPLINLI